MATFQNFADVPKNIPSQLTLVVGNVLRFKLVPGPGEKVPFKLTITQPSVLSLVDEDVREAPNYQIYKVKAERIGIAQFSAKNDKGAAAGPVSVTVKAALKLPSDGDALALTQLLLAESTSPYDADYDAKDIKTGMHWMRRVIQNRLDMKSRDVGTANAKSLIDVIKSTVKLASGKESVQFKGFENYPTIAEAQLKTINDIIKIAGDGTHPKHKLFYDHVAAAIAVPNEKLITDPCPTKLFSWRTSGSASPGERFKLYKTFAGQDFYTIP